MAKPTGAGLRVYLDQNVKQAGYDRFEWMFREFDGNCLINVSGGKDSTVVLALALEVAERLDYLPVKVAFIDQEAEWRATVEIVRQWMDDPRVDGYWYQMPFRYTNATAGGEGAWFHAWDPDARELWIHDPQPDSVRENTFPTDRFKPLFGALLDHHSGGKKGCAIAGVRAEESPARRKGLCFAETYKGRTWGAIRNRARELYVWYPLYDWSYTDIWKFIGEQGLTYSRLYDAQYQLGIRTQHMRVSSLNHEMAVRSLFVLQELEPDTYERVVKRIPGVHMTGQFGSDFWPEDKPLPPMFGSWREYRDYLLEKLCDDDMIAKVSKVFRRHEKLLPPDWWDYMFKIHIQTIIAQDRDGVFCESWMAMPSTYGAVRDWKEEKAKRELERTKREVAA